MCIHSGVLLNNRPVRDGVNKINREALTRKSSVFFSEKSSIIYMFKEQQSVSGIRYKHVVKYNFHRFFFAFSPELGYNSYGFFVFTLQNWAGFTELLVSFLKSSGEVSFFCSVTFQSLCSPLITPISSVKRTFAARQRDRKAKSIMRPDIFSRISDLRVATL